MGCGVSAPKKDGAKRRFAAIGEVAVFLPGIRVPKSVDFVRSLGGDLPESLVGRLAALRARVVAIAAQVAPRAVKPKRGSTRHGGSVFAELRQALEQYLSVLLGLAEDGSLRDRVEFVWVNQEDDAEETAMANAWYEVLSVLHLMAMLCLSEANMLLLPRTPSDVHHPRVSEESKRNSVDIFLKAAGYLDCTIRHVLPQIPSELRSDLPVDLTEVVLQALCMQALGQGVDVQLGMAIDSPKATLAVKRRLACEMVKYWHQALDNIIKPRFINGWGEKHRLYVKWKYAEAKAAAYYYHGLMLDEGNTEKSHGLAVASLHAAEEFLIQSNKACQAFHAASPKSRILETAPTLPDFALSLKPDEYQLPPLDPSWKKEMTSS